MKVQILDIERFKPHYPALFRNKVNGKIFLFRTPNSIPICLNGVDENFKAGDDRLEAFEGQIVLENTWS